MAEEQQALTERLATEDDSVFQKKGLLNANKVIDEERIYGRNEQLDKVLKRLKPAVDGGWTKDILLHGHSGTGKSLILNSVCNAIKEVSTQNGYNVGFVTVNCNHLDTEFEIVTAILRQLAEQAPADIKVRDVGVSVSHQYSNIYEVAGKHFESVIIGIDEIDRLGREPSDHAYNNVLYNLSRAEEISQHDPDITLAVMTNDARSLFDNIDTRTASSFEPDRIIFSDYTPKEISEILKRRRDAFKDGALSDDVIPLIGAKIGSAEGDARLALNLLRLAGERADKAEEDTVRKKHVQEAREDLESEIVLRELKGTSHQKLVSVLSVALSIHHRPKKADHKGAPLDVVCKTYRALQRIDNKKDPDLRSRNTIRRYLKEFETSSLLEVETVQLGRGRGRATFYSLTVDSGPTIDAVETQIGDEYLEERELVREHIKKSHKKWDQENR